ncbi:response regulator [Chitinimonas sp.]|uniref:response regulator n=1 Tax=Chitinimonas sp. TaxID=1934313 RepID=UPI002F950457
MTRLLLVDDEPNVLAALKRCLSVRDEFDSRECDYQFSAYTNPHEALQIAEQQPFDLVISDYRMPQMDGVRFLTELRLLQPDCISLILSGMTDLEGLIRAINLAGIYRFVNKPWNDMELRACVSGALAQQRLTQENQRMADELRLLRSRSTEQERELARLEREHPGITRVRWGPDGSVLFE